MLRIAFGSMMLFVLLHLTGCGGAAPTGTAEPNKIDALNDIANMIRNYSGQFKKGPQKIADLTRFESGCPVGFSAVQKNEIVISWGATMGGEGETLSSEAIVAYEKQTPESGGWVLLQNGQTKEMTADKFKSSTLATK
jgi:hypothetical protein